MPHHHRTTQQTAIQLLQRRQLRLTACRISVVHNLLEQKNAISQPELENELQDFDRVTLYRTLHTFLEKGIIHQIYDDSGVIKYALCTEHCDHDHLHQDEHVHFKCMLCKQITCVDSVSIPTIQLPQVYTFVDANFLVRGICSGCQKK
jgi:Fur family ferric uptake transcriptional regulator